MHAIATISDMQSLINLQANIIQKLHKEAAHLKMGFHRHSVELFSHKWTMIRVPVDVCGYDAGSIDEQNIRTAMKIMFARNSHPLLRELISPFSADLRGKWFPLLIPTHCEIKKYVMRRNGNRTEATLPENVLVWLSNIIDRVESDWTVEDLNSMIMYAMTDRDLKPTYITADLFSAHHALMSFARKAMWMYLPKFKVAK